MRRSVCLALLGIYFAIIVSPARAGDGDSAQLLDDETGTAGTPTAPNIAGWPGECGNHCQDRWYAGAEYLTWWLRESRIPALLTTGTFASVGKLGNPGTEVLYGDERLETRHGDRFVGTRLTLGYWLDPTQGLGLEAKAFFLERDSTHFKAISTGDTLLARPYISALDGSPQSEIIAGPVPGGGAESGAFVGYSRIELFGQEANLVIPALANEALHLDVLVGTRFLQMRDRLDLTATSQVLPDQTTLLGVTDHFRADNQFYGGQVGVRGSHTWGRWSFNLGEEAALGATEQTVRAFGERLSQTPTQRIVQPFGLSVLASNTGRFSRADLDAVFETTAQVGYQLTDHIRILGGYTFLYWNNPIRAGDQVDVIMNPSQLTGPLVGPARPAVPFREDSFWAQGASAGLEFSW
jgi:hypothetical protein